MEPLHHPLQQLGNGMHMRQPRSKTPKIVRGDGGRLSRCSCVIRGIETTVAIGMHVPMDEFIDANGAAPLCIVHQSARTTQAAKARAGAARPESPRVAMGARASEV